MSYLMVLRAFYKHMKFNIIISIVIVSSLSALSSFFSRRIELQGGYVYDWIALYLMQWIVLQSFMSPLTRRGILSNNHFCQERFIFLLYLFALLYAVVYIIPISVIHTLFFSSQYGFSLQCFIVIALGQTNLFLICMPMRILLDENQKTCYLGLCLTFILTIPLHILTLGFINASILGLETISQTSLFLGILLILYSIFPFVSKVSLKMALDQ